MKNKNMKIIAFVPIKLNSQRLSNKNILNLGNKPLCYYIFNTLKKINLIDKIYVFCSDERIKDYIPNDIIFLKRDKSLDKNNVLGMDIYQSFISQVKSDIYVLCHATSPFISENSIKLGLNNIIQKGYDSSCSSQNVNTFCWYNNKPLNYLLNNIPKTQNIKPIIIETSAFYAFKKEVIENKRRIGNNHSFVETNYKESIDIDTEDDFKLAKIFLSN
jgi:CMP-N-acetylneuraminic acid synthetase